MIPGSEELLKAIAKSMIETIPEQWSSAQFDVIFFPDHSLYEAEYKRKVDGVSRGFSPAPEGARAFRRLRQLFREAGKPLWGTATLTLKPKGKFNISWGYDNCDKDGDALFDEVKELQRHNDRLERLSRK
jgi:hypothetical protein